MKTKIDSTIDISLQAACRAFYKFLLRLRLDKNQLFIKNCNSLFKRKGVFSAFVWRGRCGKEVLWAVEQQNRSLCVYSVPYYQSTDTRHRTRVSKLFLAIKWGLIDRWNVMPVGGTWSCSPGSPHPKTDSRGKLDWPGWDHQGGTTTLCRTIWRVYEHGYNSGLWVQGSTAFRTTKLANCPCPNKHQPELESMFH